MRWIWNAIVIRVTIWLWEYGWISKHPICLQFIMNLIDCHQTSQKVESRSPGHTKSRKAYPSNDYSLSSYKYSSGLSTRTASYEHFQRGCGLPCEIPYAGSEPCGVPGTAIGRPSEAAHRMHEQVNPARTNINNKSIRATLPASIYCFTFFVYNQTSSR